MTEHSYEIVYFNEDIEFTYDKTESFAVYELNEDKTKQRFVLQYINGEKSSVIDDEWTDYVSIKYTIPLTEKEMFVLCL
jgi:hypothetical protein